MAILARDKNQLTYIYSSLSHLGKQVLGYVQGTRKKVEIIDIANENIGDTIWVELAENLDLPLGDLFATRHPDVPDIGNTEDFDTDDWLKIMRSSWVRLISKFFDCDYDKRKKIESFPA